jgi:hypothetical protein
MTEIGDLDFAQGLIGPDKNSTTHKPEPYLVRASVDKLRLRFPKIGKLFARAGVKIIRLDQKV